MQMNEKVLTALEVLKDCAENELDRLIIERCERDLIQPPKVEIIDEDTQEFLGTKYRKKKSGHYFNDFSAHRAIFSYYHGSIPNSLDLHHKDMDKANNDIFNLELLTKSGHHQKHWEEEGTVKLICAECGKEFLAHRRIKKGTNAFCSKECVLNARKNSIPSIEKFCPVYGQKFLAKSQLKMYCSRSCARKANHHQKK